MLNTKLKKATGEHFNLKGHKVSDMQVTTLETSTIKVVLEAQGEYIQRRVCFVNIQSSLDENVIFSVCVCRVYHTYYVEFHFRFRRLISFPV